MIRLCAHSVLYEDGYRDDPKTLHRRCFEESPPRLQRYLGTLRINVVSHLGDSQQRLKNIGYLEGHLHSPF